ncbi:Zinc finger, C2CH-type [Cinara cedri]|uniref:Zinc finger, C2CH-type n=1 Tax=Cinara cedri TaxID=506608 RepID=A0A5E4MBV2_9HEMI|nr:Zinc finger, C2CH-type [Cinara cedri]
MGYKCFICGVKKESNNNIKLYKFPNDDILHTEWLKKCGIKKSLLSYRICNIHFSPIVIKQNRLLMPHAVPSLHLSTKINLTSNNDNLCSPYPSNEDGSPENVQPSTSSELNTLSPHTHIKKRLSISHPRYFNDLSEKHFDTPEKVRSNLAFAKKQYNDIKKKFKIVHERNKRLIKKIKAYKDVIKKI